MNNSAYYLKLLLFICVLFVSGCATIIFNSIPLKDISKTSGQYHVGTQTLYLVDSSRSMWFSDDISRPREISVKIWYPANEMNLIKKARYLDDSELIGEVLSDRLGVAKALMRRAKGIKCNSWLDAMPLPTLTVIVGPVTAVIGIAATPDTGSFALGYVWFVA